MPDMMNAVPIAANTILTALMKTVSERVMPVLTRQPALCSGVRSERRQQRSRRRRRSKSNSRRGAGSGFRAGIKSGQDRQKGTLTGLGRLAWQEQQQEKPTAPGMTVC
jgi:hypothetical protein